MKTETRKRARERLDERLVPLKPAERFRAPPKGWVRAVRDALGMSGVQFARRLGVQPPSVAALEASEESGAIQLKTLRRAAEALDCTLVYALVPNDTLEGAVRARAQNRLARSRTCFAYNETRSAGSARRQHGRASRSVYPR